jgi:hypothetical protein
VRLFGVGGVGKRRKSKRSTAEAGGDVEQQASTRSAHQPEESLGENGSERIRALVEGRFRKVIWQQQ